MSVTYYTASGQNNFNAVTTVGLPVWDKVLPVPNDAVVFRQRFMQTAASYSPLALDTAYSAAGSYGVPSSPTFYLVDETNFTDERGGLLSWDRVYARVPTQWSEPEEFAFTYPGYVVPIVVGTSFPVTAITASGSNYVLTTTATGISANDQVYFSVTYTRGGLPYSAAMFQKAVAASSGNSVTIAGVLPGSGAFASEAGTIRKSNPGRITQRSLIVGSRVIHDYAFSTVPSLDAVLPLVNQFTPVDATGYEAAYLSTGSATIPTSAEYAAMINGNSELVGETSARRRFLGNIYVRSTRLVPAR